MYDSKTREKRYTCRALLMNVKVIENLSLLTPVAFGHLSTDITENFLGPKDVKLHPVPGGGGGVLPVMAYTGRLALKGYLFRLQVYSDERVGISLVEVPYT